jgi:hypothetical protein
VQVVAPNTLPNYADEVLKLTTGCAIEATGMIVPSPAKGQLFEMQASAIRVVGWVDDPDTYPIQPKPHSLEFLRGVDHREVRRRHQPKRPAVREPTDRHDRRRQQWQAAPIVALSLVASFSRTFSSMSGPTRVLAPQIGRSLRRGRRRRYDTTATRAEANLRIAMLTAKLKLLDGPPHTL